MQTQDAENASRIKAVPADQDGQAAAQGGGVPSSPDDVIVANGSNMQGTIQMVDSHSDVGEPPTPPVPATGARPQIGPFPVPPQVAQAAPPGALRQGAVGQLEEAMTAPPGAPPLPGQTTAPPVALPSFQTPDPTFGQRWSNDFKSNVGENMTKSAFKSALEGAGIGGVVGVEISPEIGGVAGFIGGFTKGMVEGPIEGALDAAGDCAD